jgi:DNA-binding transcriptional MerR regulator
VTVRSHTIGEVLNRLRDEFDDITISKIRFLESEGLIHPDRTESGYRKFSEADVDRLRYVLRAERDRRLSPPAIRLELERIDSGAPNPAEDSPSTSLDPADPEGDTYRFDVPDVPDVRLTATELADAAGLSSADVEALVDHGILRGETGFGGIDLLVAMVVARMLDAGLEARHLRMYRQAAERESALVEQLIAPLLRQRNPDSRRRATAAAEDLAGLGSRLRVLLLHGELQQVLGRWR